MLWSILAFEVIAQGNAYTVEVSQMRVWAVEKHHNKALLTSSGEDENLTNRQDVTNGQKNTTLREIK